jgi:Family 4 Glycosyltransferase in conflict systems
MQDWTLPQIRPCVISHNMALGGAQTAVLRMIDCLPDWVRERTTLYVQSQDTPLLDAAVARHGFDVGDVTFDPPEDASCYVLSYGDQRGLPARPTSLVLHSWDDEGWRFIQRAYAGVRGLTVAGVSQQVLDRYADWIADNGHTNAGVLPPPVTEFGVAKGRGDARQIVVAWMGRPLEAKGLMSLPYLLQMDSRLVVRAWTGAETAGLSYTRRVQTEAMDKVLALADRLGVADRFDVRPLDFDPFSYRHRLEGAHVLLGNSRKEGFLLTAAEALSCGVPVVVTRTCGVAEFVTEGVNGCLIDWDEDPKRLARAAYPAVLRAAKLDPMFCLHSARKLSTKALYRRTYGQTLDTLFHYELQHEDARVTVGVRIHQGTDESHLDDAINSIATQTYRRFKVVLLVDGPWSMGERLARRYDLPLVCTGLKADMTHCSWLHRTAVERCDTEFYKPLDYDDQLLPDYLERAVAAMDEKKLDVYGCKLLTLEAGELSERAWPHKPIETMFTGNSDDNMLPHSSVLMRTDIVRKAGNYQKRAVGLGADDYHLWFRIHKVGGKFFRDDDVRHVAYRIHEKNTLKKRRRRYDPRHASATPTRLAGRWIASATAAGLALVALGGVAPAKADTTRATQPCPDDAPTPKPAPKKTPQKKKGDRRGHRPSDATDFLAIVPPHS